MPDDTAVTWRVSARRPVLSSAGALTFAVGGLVLSPDKVGLLLCSGAAALLLLLAARDAFVRTRLTAGPGGVSVVRWPMTTVRLTWPEITQITVERRSRLGLRVEVVEIDTEHELFLLGGGDLGAEPQDVVATLLSFTAESRTELT